MTITLHQATEQVRELLDQIDPETGLIPEGYDDARALVERKAVACVAYLIESGRNADSVEAYAKELLAKAKTQRKREEWLRQYLMDHMNALGITEIKDERGIFKATLQPQRDQSVDVFDAEQLPDDYLREIPAKYEPDKTAIKSALQDGYDVPGARLVWRDRLTIK